MGETDDDDHTSEVFSTDRMRELVGTLRVTASPDVIEAFRCEINTHAARWQHIIRTTPLPLPKSPFNKTTTERTRWLERNVINPGDKLLEALKEENRAYFSPWTAEHDIELPLIDDGFIEKHQRLVDYTRELKSWLEYYKNENAGLYAELKYEIVDQLVELIREHFPDTEVSRGTYVSKKHGREGDALQFLRDAYFEITGVHDPLDSPLQQSV